MIRKEREATYMWIYSKDRSYLTSKIIFLFGMMCLLLTGFLLPKTYASAAEIAVKEINYYNSSMTLQVSNRDTEVYYSDANKKNWEVLEGEWINDNTIVMDISWVSPLKNQVITLKGNYEEKITTVVIPKQATNFKASYNKLKGTMSFSNVGARTIQWRKKNSSTWKTVNQSTIATELSYFFTNGATVVFRLAPINGYDHTNVGMRASKEVTVTIPKKATAPSVKLDGSKFVISAAKGLVYRKVESDGSVGQWITKSSSSDLLLADVAKEAMYHSDGTMKEVTLQFRKNATSSSQVSNIATLVIPIQEGPPKEEKDGITLSYTSSSSLSIQVKSASATTPFEYTIVKKDQSLNYNSAKWSTIDNNNGIAITKSNAPEGSRIYLRKKTMEASEGIEYRMASVELEITGANGLVYPSLPKAQSLTKLITIAGVNRADNGASNLTFTLYSPTETKVSQIEAYDIYGNKKGTLESSSSVIKNISSQQENDLYIITSKITSTSNVDSVTDTLMYLRITMANGDVIHTNESTGVHFYQYPKSKVAAIDKADYSSNFTRIYGSHEVEDPSKFKFQVNMGTNYVIDTTSVGNFTSEETKISFLVFDGITLTQGKDYQVEYGHSDSSGTKRMATITVWVDQFEDRVSTRNLDKKVPLLVNLNNKEVLNQEVYINFISTATVKDIPIAWSITEGSLKETQTKKVTDSEGNVTTIVEDLITFMIELDLFDSSYSVGVSDVTWGGKSIMDSATVSGGKANIYLSNRKINRLATNTTETRSLVITLSNGFVIENGVKLTIINGQ